MLLPGEQTQNRITKSNSTLADVLRHFVDEQSLYNPRLHRRYDVRDGIPVMLIDEATSVDDAEHDRLIAKAASDGVEPTFAE